MGTEIDHADFSREDYAEFYRRLREETALLSDWIAERVFDNDTTHCGFELEACLVDAHCAPCPRNAEFLSAIDSPLLVPELARFNFEINSTPHPQGGNMLRELELELTDTWQQCEVAARPLSAMPLMAGILPTLRNTELNLSNVSNQQRYLALNREVLRLRGGRPLQIAIAGESCKLEMAHNDVMAEAATTSLQVHLQAPQDQATRVFNAAQIIAAPLLAATANSPYLFETALWQETRIPLFEQAVAVPPWHDLAGNAVQRVTFGSHHVADSLLELFEENRDCIPVLLPVLWDAPAQELRHLRLHNGTVWRWNRPLIGLPPLQPPHLRVEVRGVPAGPSIPDVIANVALVCGLVHALSDQLSESGTLLPFEDARGNFYAAARHGLAATLNWFGKRVTAQTLLLETLLPAARAALLKRDFAAPDISMYLDEIMQERVRSGQTGAAWQLRYVGAHGADFQAMTQAMLERQRQRIPVHEWSH